MGGGHNGFGCIEPTIPLVVNYQLGIGEVSLEVDYGYEIINIICEKCGIEVDNESRVENK